MLSSEVKPIISPKDEVQTLVDAGVLLITIRSSSAHSKEVRKAAHKRMISNVLRIPREKEMIK